MPKVSEKANVSVTQWLQNEFKTFNELACTYSAKTLEAHARMDTPNVIAFGAALEMYLLAKQRTKQILVLWEKAKPIKL